MPQYYVFSKGKLTGNEFGRVDAYSSVLISLIPLRIQNSRKCSICLELVMLWYGKFGNSEKSFSSDRKINK